MHFFNHKSSHPPPQSHALTHYIMLYSYNSLLHNSNMCRCCIAPSGLWPALGCKVRPVCCTKLKDCCHGQLRGFQSHTPSTLINSAGNRQERLARRMFSTVLARKGCSMRRRGEKSEKREGDEWERRQENMSGKMKRWHVVNWREKTEKELKGKVWQCLTNPP